MKIVEERNRLIKIRIYKQGSSQWRLLPVEKKDGSSIRKGEITFRGDEEAFRKLLMKLKAKDVETDPPSVKGKTYQQMINTAKDGSDPYIWVWLKIWNKYRNDNRLTIAEGELRLISKTIFLENCLKKFIDFYRKNRYNGVNSVLTALDDFMQINDINLVWEDFEDLVALLENKYIMENKESKLGFKEARYDYEIYHDTFSSAIEEVIEFAKKNNLYFSSNDIFTEITTGAGRPKNGETRRYSMVLYNRDGTPAGKGISFQIADLGKRYELNAYFFPAKKNRDYPYEQVEIHESKAYDSILISESVKIGNVILDKGDRIRVIQEAPFDERKFMSLIESLPKMFPWDSKPVKYTESGMSGLDGTINGQEVSFVWHQPGRYGSDYNFLGLITRENGQMVERFNSLNEPDKALENLKKAIDYVKKGIV